MPTLRRRGLVLLLAAIVVLAPACDTDDPLEVSSQTVQLYIAAPNVTVPIYDVWEVYQDGTGAAAATDGPDDIDGDGSADVFKYCRVAGAGTAQSVPWNFLIEVLVTSADGTSTRRITSQTAFSNESVNRALYNERFPPPGAAPAPQGNPAENPVTPVPVRIVVDATTTRWFRFRNAVRRFGSQRDIVTAVDNPLRQLRPSFFDGRCPGFFLSALPGGVPGEAMIDNKVQPLTFVLNDGETVSVRAILGDTAPPGFGITTATQQKIAAALKVGGLDVIPQGSTDGFESISFTYTLR